MLGSPVRSHRRQLVRSRIMDDFEGRRRDIWEFETQSKDMRPHIRPTVAILKIKYGSGTNPKWWRGQQPLHVSWRIPSCGLDATWAKTTTDLMGNVKILLQCNMSPFWIRHKTISHSPIASIAGAYREGSLPFHNVVQVGLPSAHIEMPRKRGLKRELAITNPRVQLHIPTPRI